jgi:hypothetical protein
MGEGDAMSNAVYLSKIAPAGDGTVGQILTSGGSNAAAWIAILPVANGGTGVTASTGASSVVLRDSNSNVTANSLFEGFTSVAAAGGTTTLTAASTPTYVVTGSGGQTYRLPDATTLPAGAIFSFNNNQTSGTVVVQGSTGTTLATLQSGSFVDFTLLVNSPAAGTWDTHAQAPSNVSWSTNTLDWTGSITSATWNGVAVAPNRGGTGIANNVASTLTISGAYATTLTITGTTGVTLPTSGTLATTANINTALPSATSSQIYVGTGAAGTAAAASTLPTGAFPALTGDVTNTAGSLATTVGKIGGNAVSLAGAFTTSGAFGLTLTTTALTNVTLPTSGTLATTANTVASFSAGTTGLTPSTATTGAVTLAGTLVAANGGTGQSSYAVGDILYASTTTALSKLADVATGSVLVSGGVGVAPAYSATPTVTSLTASTSLTSPIYNSSTTLSLQTGGTTGVYIDASQNVGIGTTSPGYTLDVRATTGSISATSNTGTNYAKLQCNNSGGSYQFGIDNSAGSNFGSGTAYSRVIWNDSSTAPTILYTSSTERMRIDSSGNLLVGTTSLPIAATRVGISGASGVSVGVVSFVNTSASTKKWSNGPDANGNFIVYNDALVGMYLLYGNNAWTASSDERVKTDLVPIENAAAKVSLLRAVTGRFKTDEVGKSRAFLIAQDVQSVLPEAVDASDPDKLGVQYTDIIPLLVAAIKELSAKVTALESR